MGRIPDLPTAAKALPPSTRTAEPSSCRRSPDTTSSHPCLFDGPIDLNNGIILSKKGLDATKTATGVRGIHISETLPIGSAGKVPSPFRPSRKVQKPEYLRTASPNSAPCKGRRTPDSASSFRVTAPGSAPCRNLQLQVSWGGIVAGWRLLFPSYDRGLLQGSDSLPPPHTHRIANNSPASQSEGTCVSGKWPYALDACVSIFLHNSSCPFYIT